MTQLQTIQAPPALPPRYSLLTAAAVLEDGERWQAGVQWSPEQSLAVDAVALECEGNAPDLESSSSSEIATAHPFVVQGIDSCSTFGWAPRDYEGRARRMLEAQQSRQIAKEFWSGAIATASGNGDTFLADDPIEVTTVASSVLNAFGVLEAALAGVAGKRGMIHCTPQALLHAVASNALVQVGPLWLTPFGTIVVADEGYDGSGPTGALAGATQWAYASTLVQVRLSPVDIIPGSLADARAYATDRATNLTVIRTVRLALLQWEPLVSISEQAYFAAEIDLPIIGGAS
jgi:hypothetical protein